MFMFFFDFFPFLLLAAIHLLAIAIHLAIVIHRAIASSGWTKDNGEFIALYCGVGFVARTGQICNTWNAASLVTTRLFFVGAAPAIEGRACICCKN